MVSFIGIFKVLGVVCKCVNITLSVYGNLNKLYQTYVRFEVFKAATTKNAVFWDVAPCKSCVNRRSVGTYRLHLQGRKIASEKPV
jgi:hypothetical protein